MKRYYLDTCIWRDYFENRSDRFRPLGEWAFRLIKKIIEREDLIIYSDLVINELKKFYSEAEIKKIMELIPSNLLFKIKYSNDNIKKSIEFSNRFKIPRQDAFHAILAKDNQAILVTRDKHFYELFKYILIRKPEDLI